MGCHGLNTKCPVFFLSKHAEMAVLRFSSEYDVFLLFVQVIWKYPSVRPDGYSAHPQLSLVCIEDVKNNYGWWKDSAMLWKLGEGGIHLQAILSCNVLKLSMSSGILHNLIPPRNGAFGSKCYCYMDGGCDNQPRTTVCDENAHAHIVWCVTKDSEQYSPIC